MLERFENAWFGLVIFIIAWCIFGIAGLIPWDYSQVDPNWEWHMNTHNAWLAWGLFVTLAATAFGFFAYAVKRWTD